jgi:hypothetical protein
MTVQAARFLLQTFGRTMRPPPAFTDIQLQQINTTGYTIQREDSRPLITQDQLSAGDRPVLGGRVRPAPFTSSGAGRLRENPPEEKRPRALGMGPSYRT